jgi:hypothetical protein
MTLQAGNNDGKIATEVSTGISVGWHASLEGPNVAFCNGGQAFTICWELELHTQLLFYPLVAHPLLFEALC